MLYYRDGRTVLARGRRHRPQMTCRSPPCPPRSGRWSSPPRTATSTRTPASPCAAWLRAVVADARRRPAGRLDHHPAVRPQRVPQPGTRRSTARRREFALAVKLERPRTKDEILERYLNTIYFGRGAYGIAAAAHAYFGVAAGPADPRPGCGARRGHQGPVALRPGGRRGRGARPLDLDRRRRCATAGWADPAPRYPPVPARAAASGPNGLVVDQVEKELAAHGITAAAAAHPRPVGRHHPRPGRSRRPPWTWSGDAAHPAVRAARRARRRRPGHRCRARLLRRRPGQRLLRRRRGAAPGRLDVQADRARRRAAPGHRLSAPGGTARSPRTFAGPDGAAAASTTTACSARTAPWRRRWSTR